MARCSSRREGYLLASIGLVVDTSGHKDVNPIIIYYIIKKNLCEKFSQRFFHLLIGFRARCLPWAKGFRFVGDARHKMHAEYG